MSYLLAHASHPAAAQAPAAGSHERGLEITAEGGLLRTDRDLAARHDPAWIPVVGAGLGYRVTPLVAIGGAAWWGELDAAADTLDVEPSRSRSLWGIGLTLDLAPFADRGGATQPVLRFGIEAVTVDDHLDRGPAFLFGAGIARRLARTWSVAARVENRFLTVERSPVGEVATSRDVSLWSVAAALAWRAGP